MTDSSVWRVVGDPLVPPASTGPLDGETVAVKDLYAVAGHRVGAGNPTLLAEAAPSGHHAWAVGRLLDAGAAVVGITQTDELAYSLAGTNAHYGTPPNPRAPGRISGGSSSGSASAVSLGEATIGLGTDTGGSIRVPAAYQGLCGIRTTHDLLSRDGLLPLAPSFDTVGWLTRDAQTLRRAGAALLPPRSPATFADIVLAEDLLPLADDDVTDAVRRFGAGLRLGRVDWPLDEWAAAFRTVQAREAWREHAPRLSGRSDILGADVRARFAYAAAVTYNDAEAARAVIAAARVAIRDWVVDKVLVLPAAPSVAPLPGDDIERVRDATLRLTCIAGIGGLPAVVLPLVTSGGLPCGVCLVGGAGRDRDLLDLAGSLDGVRP